MQYMEKAYQSEAFETYYNLGKDRSLEKVAEITGYAPATIAGWSHKFNWKNRIQERDKQDLAIMRRQRLEESEKMRTIYQESIRTLLAERFLKPLKDGMLDIDIQNINDIIKLINLDMTLERIDKEDERFDENTRALSEEEARIVEMINGDGDVWSSLTEKLLDKQKEELSQK